MTLPSWLQRGLPLIVLALLVAMSYSGVVHNGYVWDDRYFLVESSSYENDLRRAISLGR